MYIESSGHAHRELALRSAVDATRALLPICSILAPPDVIYWLSTRLVLYLASGLNMCGGGAASV
jgi:hypothetical protein